MSRLGDQFPGARRISAADVPSDDPQQLLKLIEPYLNWVMAEMDTASTDVLIWDPRTEGQQAGGYNLVILCGTMSVIWLQHRKSPGTAVGA